MILFNKEKEFQNIYTAYAGNVQRTLRGMTGSDSIAEELTQEAFIKAWKGLPQFSFKSSLKTWVFQVAINVGRDWLRTHKNRSFETWNEKSEGQDSQEFIQVQEALSELSDERREILLLFYYEGMTNVELAKILLIPIGTVKSRLYQARSQLKEILIKKGSDL